MKKYNKLCYPILLCISFLYIYGTHVNRKNNHFYEIKHDEIVHNILNNENFDKEYKIKAIRSLKYYNKKYQNRLIAKLHGTYKRKNKNSLQILMKQVSISTIREKIIMEKHILKSM